MDAKYLPPFAKSNRRKALQMDDLLDAVKSDKLFGMVECDIAIPAEWPRGPTTDVPINAGRN